MRLAKQFQKGIKRILFGFSERNLTVRQLNTSLSDTLNMKVGPVIILVLFTCNVAHSQAQHGQSGSSTQSSLTITATVEPSVWLIMEPDGNRDVVVANAPDSKESFSHVPVKAGKKNAAAKKETSSFTSQELPRHQDDAAVQFTFPIAPPHFEVTKKNAMMEVSEGGKAYRRPVMVTMVVPQ